MTEENTQTPAEEKVETPQAEEKKEVSVPDKFKALVETVEKLSVLELSELVKVLEEKFGVSASAPVAAVAVAGGVAEAVEEKTEFDVELVAAGDNKIGVIKVVKELTGLGLKDAKDLVDAAPKVIKEKIKKEEAEAMKTKLVEAGATVNLK